MAVRSWTIRTKAVAQQAPWLSQPRSDAARPGMAATSSVSLHTVGNNCGRAALLCPFLYRRTGPSSLARIFSGCYVPVTGKE